MAANWSRWAINTFLPSKTQLNHMLTGVPWIWKIINNVPFLHDMALRYVYLSNLPSNITIYCSCNAEY